MQSADEKALHCLLQVLFSLHDLNNFNHNIISSGKSLKKMNSAIKNNGTAMKTIGIIDGIGPHDHTMENDFTLVVPIRINSATQRDYPAIIELWELSVRTSHFFLPEEYFQTIKNLLPSILPAVKLFIYLDKDNKTITGLLGVSEEKIEMLFIHPDKRGQGIGTLLNKFAVEQLHTRKIDVNEQNEKAVGFYKKMGYNVVGRTELDSLGKPFPILQMEYRNNS